MKTTPRYLLALLAACSSTPAPSPPPKQTPPPVASASARAPMTTAVTTAVPSAAPAPAPTPPAEPKHLAMYPVMKIWSLVDIWPTEGGIELRVGFDPGGGAMGKFRFVPFEDGQPDWNRETSYRYYANTAWLHKKSSTGGYIELAGKRPNLVFHEVSGFRSAASDGYSQLTATGEWHGYDNVNAAGSLGIGIEAWSQGRILEWRGPNVIPGQTALLPLLRVLGPKRALAPSLPAALQEKLESSGFHLDTQRVFTTGEVVAVGRLTLAEGFGTVVWRKNLRRPDYFVTPKDVDDDSELTILGGDTLDALRMWAGDELLKLEGRAWKVVSEVQDGELPDVWFGSPLIHRTDDAAFARTAADAPWLPVQVHSKEKWLTQTFAVETNGTIWKTEDDILYSNIKPKGPMQTISEADIVKMRKKSILRGGSYDVSGRDVPDQFHTKCRQYFVVMHRAPEKKASDAAYAPIARVLKGKPELEGAKLIVTKERGVQFFGVSVKSYEQAKKLEKLVDERLKKQAAVTEYLCAEPPVLRELTIDPATGKLSG